MNTTPAKRITIVAERLLEDRLVRDLLLCGAKGYTITDARGAGSRGVRVSEWEGGNIRLETLVSATVADAILELLNKKYFEHFAVIATLENVEVVRGGQIPVTTTLETNKLITVDALTDIPLEHRQTPIGRLLEYHNLGRELESVEKAEILLGMCMDNRHVLRTPDNFAFVLRTTGANLRHNEFRVAYAIGVGGVRHIALIAHTYCGMVGLSSRMNAFVRGMVDAAGWDETQAKEYFFQYAPFFEIEDEIEFVRLEAQRLRARYPKVGITPLLYKLEDNRLYLVRES